MYMFLPFLTAFIGLIVVWFDRRFASLTLLAVSTLILVYWLQIHATNHLNISL